MKVEGGLVYLTAEEMVAADGEAIRDFGISALVLMENAGAQTARVSRILLGAVTEGKHVACLVGKGNNGGDGLVAARRLKGWGAEVTVMLSGDRRDLRDAPAIQASIAEKMGIAMKGSGETFDHVDLIVDALLGYSSKGDPREPTASLIRAANGSGAPILAVDIPSGLDATTGEPGNPCIDATATVTFAYPKTGFLGPKARRHTGSLYLADIGIPAPINAGSPGVGSVFARDSLVKVW